VFVCERGRERVCLYAREGERGCVFVCERGRERVCVCMRGRAGEACVSNGSETGLAGVLKKRCTCLSNTRKAERMASFSSSKLLYDRTITSISPSMLKCPSPCHARQTTRYSPSRPSARPLTRGCPRVHRPGCGHAQCLIFFFIKKIGNSAPLGPCSGTKHRARW